MPGLRSLKKIGPAIIFTHSQSGAYGWAIADARPALVKGIVAIEAGSRPFREVEFIGAPDWFRTGRSPRPGDRHVPLGYAPQVSDPSEFATVMQDKPDGPGLARCILQKEPVRQLVNLKSIPIMILVGEAGFHAVSDHCNSLFLKQAGVDNDFVRLPDIGIRGNSHYLMLEKNSDQIAGVVANWLRKRVTPVNAGPRALTDGTKREDDMSNWLRHSITAAMMLAMFSTFAKAEGVGPIVIAKQGHFFVGGKYYDTPQGQVFAGQAYVEFQIPENRTHPYPIIMIEGCCHVRCGLQRHSRGRDGWVQYFLSKGYAVYVMDQVGRGRSPYVEAI